jgi:acylphosphatase
MTEEMREVEYRGFRVEGRVQGVGFRWWTQKTAESLGLGGSVRNLPDGSVEVHVVGSASEVARLEEMLARGPVTARVDSVVAVAPAPGLMRERFRVLF